MAYTEEYPRDLIGYGANPPDPRWPGKARLAVQFVLNYEEGGENCVLDGDQHAETFLSEMANVTPYPARHLSMESLYEYGSRVGVWRVLNEFKRRNLPLTIFGVARALERNPEVLKAIQEAGHEIACHGLRWLHYQEVPEATERQHMEEALALITKLTGETPLGWYTGRDSPNTRRLVVDQDKLLYDSDYYGDDLPFWMPVKNTAGETKQHLVVPYTLDCNDMRFASSQGFGEGEELFNYLRDAFDVMYAEGAEHPKMMSIGLHCRMVAKPGRFRALQKFLDHIARYDDIWITRRVDIAKHWAKEHPAK